MGQVAGCARHSRHVLCVSFPKGPRTQLVLGPKYYIINDIWALEPYYLDPWTLRAVFLLCFRGFRVYAFGFRA